MKRHRLCLGLSQSRGHSSASLQRCCEASEFTRLCRAAGCSEVLHHFTHLLLFLGGRKGHLAADVPKVCLPYLLMGKLRYMSQRWFLASFCWASLSARAQEVVLRASGYVLVAPKSLAIQSSQWFAGIIRECILDPHHPEPELEPAEIC